VFCDNCRRLLPADGLNHFQLFGLTPAFDLDAVVLRQRYLQISRGVHPDHQAAEAGASTRLSALLNEGYRILSDPVLRAEYLLEVLGGAPAMNDRGVLDGVLANTLTLREELLEARAARDAAALAACRTHVQRRYDELLGQIIGLATRLPQDAAARQPLRATLNSIKYYQKLLAEF
jgi:molecular chaperone HscB